MRVLSRRGSALLWVITFVAVTAAIAAAASPYLAALSDATRVNSTVTSLKAIRTGILTFQTVVHRTGANNTLNFPGKISQLTTVVGATDHNSCGSGAGNTFNVANSQADWITHGPFTTFYVPVGGFFTPLGMIRDSIPARATANDSLYIEIPGVTIDDAARLKLTIDNGTGDTVGTRHGAVGGGLPDTTTVWFRILSSVAATNISRC